MCIGSRRVCLGGDAARSATAPSSTSRTGVSRKELSVSRKDSREYRKLLSVSRRGMSVYRKESNVYRKQTGVSRRGRGAISNRAVVHVQDKSFLDTPTFPPIFVTNTWFPAHLCEIRPGQVLPRHTHLLPGHTCLIPNTPTCFSRSF